MGKYYKIKVRCTNCGYHYDMDIVKGLPVESALECEQCKNCRCIDAVVPDLL